MINIKCYVVGEIGTNCYLIEDEATKKRAVIDPGDRCDELYQEIDSRGGTLEYILLTHGHYDHILGVAQLCTRYHPAVVASKDELEVLQKGAYNRTSIHNIRLNAFSVDRLLDDGEKFFLGESEITFMHTPGHTKGSGMYLIDDCIFSGDTLFCESVGRTDFETSDPSAMMRSIERIKEIQGERNVFPGHGYFTTLSHEKKYNPFF